MPKQTADPPIPPVVTRLELATASPFSTTTATLPRRKQPPLHATPPAQPDAPPDQLLAVAQPPLRVKAKPTVRSGKD